MSKKEKKTKLPKIFGSKSGSGNGSGGGDGTRLGMTIVAFILTALPIILFIFAITGGINQRKFIEASAKLGENIGKTVSGWLGDGKNIEVTDDGIYIRPEKE